MHVKKKHETTPGITKGNLTKAEIRQPQNEHRKSNDDISRVLSRVLKVGKIMQLFCIIKYSIVRFVEKAEKQAKNKLTKLSDITL